MAFDVAAVAVAGDCEAALEQGPRAIAVDRGSRRRRSRAKPTSLWARKD
jgi:hypothetical protein